MKYTAATLALVAGATAHTVMSEIYIDGQGQGSGTCVRAPLDPVGAVDPVIDLGSKDMACGKDGTQPVRRTCPITGGHQLSFEYRQWPEDYSRGPLDMGHMGPCSVYLKKVDDATKDTAAGDGWFKLWDEGYDESSGKWCTQKMIGNAGRISVTIPDSLAGGDYLVRPELLALHNIAVKNQPEYYVGCAQIFLESTGSAGPAETVSIPGYTSMSDSGNQYNAFDKPLKPFTVPGPKVYKSVESGAALKSQKQVNGVAPSDCVLSNGNWCGTELPDFSDEDGCWNADKDCWAKLDECYDDASSAGSENCKVWEQKCKSNQQICYNGGGNGPADKGKNITPVIEMIKTPASSNGGLDYGSSSGAGSSDSGSDSQNDEAASSAAPTSSAAPSSSAAAPSPDSYKQKEKAPAYDAPAYSAPTPAADKPAPPAEQPQATTLVTKPAPQNNDQGNVVYETVYQTVEAYTTVYGQAYETAAPAHYRRHAHRRHGLN